MATVLQFSVREFIPGSLTPGGLTLANFTALLKPLYARVFLDTVWICFLTAFCTLLVSYPLAYALVHVRHPLLKSAILITVITPLFLGEVVRTYSWIIVFGNNGFINSILLALSLIERPVQFMFTTFAVVVALVHVTIPIMVIMLATALAHIDRSYLKAAESSRCRPNSCVCNDYPAAIDAGHHCRLYDRVRMDLQCVRDPAANWRWPNQHDIEFGLSARVR